MCTPVQTILGEMTTDVYTGTDNNRRDDDRCLLLYKQ